MKRMMMIMLTIGMTAMSSMSMAAMSTSRVRTETRFLTDKMAYELNMNTMQYDDAYEINYDFIYSIRHLMDDVVRGHSWALEKYYDLLDIRNDDLRWILSSNQYRRFMTTEDFFRPVYAHGNQWNFRIYIRYTNHNHYYFGKPKHYSSYNGNHYRSQHNNKSYYRGRYNHTTYDGAYSVRNNRPSPNRTPQTGTRPSNNTHSGGHNRVSTGASGTDRKPVINNTNNNNRRNNSEVRGSSSSDNNRRSSTGERSGRSNSGSNRSSRSSGNNHRR